MLDYTGTDTDESFTNANLGDCLDYSNNFTEEQIRPGTINYERLEEKYGTVNRARALAVPEYSGKRRSLPEWASQEYARHEELLTAGNIDDLVANGWVVLGQSDHGVDLALGLGDGMYVRAAMLLAN